MGRSWALESASWNDITTLAVVVPPTYSTFHNAFSYEGEHAAGTFVIAQAVEGRLCGGEGEDGGRGLATQLYCA